MDSKDSTFSGHEKNRNTLWTSILRAAQQALEANETGDGVLFDLADATKEFDECLKAIAASSSGPLDDRQAKRQLLASLDEFVYKEVAAALRLDPELDKVDIEDIFVHVVEVWEKLSNTTNPEKPKQAGRPF
ncbi:hypothetical protein CYMTET_12985 [Cymbomonas tetramitiformis]|uniref:Uncharacterized protein n=1 Tax=Cymbomonas tetramitiformis TaxID=36881 RepID=A0AAE0GJB9_9CHLO|nr:hypothetical protein CYMTET_12985 [Cymbomonas tetramitiformis]